MAGKNIPEDMNLPPINEWIAAELARTKDQLTDLAVRHENILNRLSDVCRRNDRMQEVGNRMRDLLQVVIDACAEEEMNSEFMDDAKFTIQLWGEANV